MLEPLFAEAWIHRPGGHSVLGRRLHPLCALDLLALEAVDSPFTKSGAPIHVEDLLLAVWICSHEHPRNCCIEHLELGAEGKAWVAEIQKALDLKADAERFEAYVADYYAVPEMMHETSKGDDGLPPGTPWILGTVLGIVKQLHVPLYDCWTMPMGQLVWYSGALAEAQSDDTRIMGPELRGLAAQSENGSRVFKVEAGESMEELARRCGCSVDEAKFLSAQAGSGRHGGKN